MNDINRDIRRLARNGCANFCGSRGCLLTPNGQPNCTFFRDDPQAQRYIEDGTLDCMYFRKAVLPTDPVLQKRYFGESTIGEAAKRRSCDRCGEAFVGKSNAAKYCRRCAGLVRRDSSREAKRKARANVRN